MISVPKENSRKKGKRLTKVLILPAFSAFCQGQWKAAHTVWEKKVTPFLPELCSIRTKIHKLLFANYLNEVTAFSAGVFSSWKLVITDCQPERCQTLTISRRDEKWFPVPPRWISIIVHLCVYISWTTGSISPCFVFVRSKIPSNILFSSVRNACTASIIRRIGINMKTLGSSL